MREYHLNLFALFAGYLEEFAGRLRYEYMIFFHVATNSNFLVRIPCRLNFFLHIVHVSMGVTFLVTLAGFASLGNFWPPYPRLRSACLRSPRADPRLLPALYIDIFWVVWVLHRGQYRRTCFGMFMEYGHDISNLSVGASHATGDVVTFHVKLELTLNSCSKGPPRLHVLDLR